MIVEKTFVGEVEENPSIHSVAPFFMANIKEIDHHRHLLPDSFIIWRVITFDFTHFRLMHCGQSSPQKITRLHCIFSVLAWFLCFSDCHPSLLSHCFWRNNEIDGMELNRMDGRRIDGLNMSCFLMQNHHLATTSCRVDVFFSLNF